MKENPYDKTTDEVVNILGFFRSGAGMKLSQGPVVKGFSILELVMTLALILLILAVALPGFNRYWQTYQLNSAAQQMFSNLDRGRYRAIARNREVVIQFRREQRSYRLFEDLDGNGERGPSEPMVGAYSLPKQVDFDSTGLSGPPASTTLRPVGDPITFGGDRFTFNPEGYCNKMGTVYLQNASGDAAAISCSLPGVGRLRSYEWQRATGTWK